MCTTSLVWGVPLSVAGLSSASDVVIPSCRSRSEWAHFTGPNSLRSSRMVREWTSRNDFNMRSDFNCVRLSGRQGGRRLMLRASSYRRSNVLQSETVPVWLWVVTSSLRVANASYQFLCEQPTQLRHIEWPTVTTVVWMAMLTLIVVTCLIVLLATVDSTMSYVLASVLRRVP